MNLFSGKRIYLCVFVVLMIIYHANGKPICQQDCIPAPYAAWSLIRNHSFDVSGYPKLERYLDGAIKATPDGKWVSCYPPGSSISAIPFVAPLALFSEKPSSSGTMRYLGKITASVYVALSGVLIYAICMALFPAAALPATIVYGVGTCLWSVASQGLWMHGPATFFVCLALYLLLTKNMSKTIALYIGLSLGMAVITRPTTILFAGATFFIFLYRRQWKELLCFITGLAIFALLLVGYNITYFNNIISSGYGHFGESWMNPLHVGLTGLLIAPSRGLFIYSPALLLVPIGIWLIIKNKIERISPMIKISIVSWCIAASITILLYAKWNCWWGAMCYGPRFLCEITPILCVVFAVAYSRIIKQSTKNFVALLITLSVYVHFVGVFGTKNDWISRYELGPYARNLFSIHDTQIQAHSQTILQGTYNSITGIFLHHQGN